MFEWRTNKEFICAVTSSVGTPRVFSHFIHFITILTYYVSLIIYYIDTVIDYNKRYILIIILIIYYITKSEHLYPLKYSLGTALSPSLSSVYSYFTYMIGLTKRSHVAPKMQHVTFCDSIVRFDWCRTKRIDSVCGGNMNTPMRERRICDSVG